MWTSSAIPYISLFCHQQTHFHILFMYHALCFPTFSFTLHVPCSSFFLIDHNQKQVLLIKRVIFVLKLKNIFLLISTFWKWSYSQRCFDVDQRCETRRLNNNTALTLSNVVNISAERDNVDLTSLTL